MACTIVGFRPLGTLSAEPHRFYTQIVRYEREDDVVKPVRISRFIPMRPHCDRESRYRTLSWGLFAGHCAWIARDIAEREARQVKRYMNGAPHRLAEPVPKTA